MSVGAREFRAAIVAALVGAGCGAAEPKAGSIGAVLSRDNEAGTLFIRDVSPGLSAERAGLQAGDEVLMIEGRYTRELDAPAVRAALRGEIGTSVRLTIVRGDQVLRVKVERGALREPGEVRPRVETIKE